MKHIPNILSAFRLALVGVFIWLFTKEQYLACLIVYLVSFGTDVLDGYLARRNNWVSNVGKVLDPLADKAMLIAVLCCFYSVSAIPLYVLVIVICKEVSMIAIGAVLYAKKIVVYSDWFGKIATGLFALAIVLTFVHLIWNWPSNPIHIYVYLVAIAVGIASFFHYGIKTFIKKQGNGRIDEGDK
ncbi:MAG: CDP-alcohol phosphatidyltransferase family protein [Clostridia bacterium]|nr:CDP-alcohol phosphatidyltransferase family protein [Clostridia bacterium]